MLDCFSHNPSATIVIPRARVCSGLAMRRVGQELQSELVKRGKGRQAEVYSAIVTGGSTHDEARTALTSMLGQRKTNPSDILTMHKLYTGGSILFYYYITTY